MTPNGRHPAARRLTIQRKLLLDGTATVEDLALELDVSVATIRRDLAQMEEEGMIRRTHGGAVIRAPRGADQAFGMREQIDSEAKRAIARAAATLIQPDQTILMNDGSTVLALAREMVAAQMPLTVATPGVNVATALSECTAISAYLLGGRVRHQTLGTSGHYAEEMLRSFNADIAFIAAEGFSQAEGLTFSYEADAALARLMRERATTAVVLATTRKLHQRDRITALNLTRIDILVTDCDDTALLTSISATGIRILRTDGQATPDPIKERIP